MEPITRDEWVQKWNTEYNSRLALKAANWLKQDMFVMVSRNILDIKPYCFGNWKVILDDFTSMTCDDEQLVELASDLGWEMPVE